MSWACCCNEAANHQLPIAAAFWITWIVSMEECSSLLQNLTQIHCSSHSFWMWQPHSRHAHSMASTTPPAISTVKSSFFTPTHSSPLSLAAKLHQCHTNCSRYINNGWTFSRHTSYTVFSIHRIKFNSWIKHSKRLTITTNNKIGQF